MVPFFKLSLIVCLSAFILWHRGLKGVVIPICFAYALDRVICAASGRAQTKKRALSKSSVTLLKALPVAKAQYGNFYEKWRGPLYKGNQVNRVRAGATLSGQKDWRMYVPISDQGQWNDKRLLYETDVGNLHHPVPEELVSDGKVLVDLTFAARLVESEDPSVEILDARWIRPATNSWD